MSDNEFPSENLNGNTSPGNQPADEFRTILDYPKGDDKIPLMLDVSLTLTKIIVILITIAVAVISILSHASWIAVISRTGLSLLILGLLGWMINWFIGKYFLEATFSEMKEKQELIEERKMANREARVRQEIASQKAAESLDEFEERL